MCIWKAEAAYWIRMCGGPDDHKTAGIVYPVFRELAFYHPCSGRL
jgi:hypothetical protein